jgi:hypothetical protein
VDLDLALAGGRRQGQGVVFIGGIIMEDPTKAGAPPKAEGTGDVNPVYRNLKHAVPAFPRTVCLSLRAFAACNRAFAISKRAFVASIGAFAASKRAFAACIGAFAASKRAFAACIGAFAASKRAFAASIGVSSIKN